MATVVYVNFYNISNTTPAPWSYNAFNSFGVAQLSADLNDDANASTGYTLDITAAFTGSTGGSGSSSVGGWDGTVFNYYIYASAATATLQVGGLTNGDTYDIELAGHRGGTGRNTDFDIDGGTKQTYVQAANPTPTTPVLFNGTVSGTTIDINVTKLSTFDYLNGIKLTITPAAGGSGIPILRRRIEGY